MIKLVDFLRENNSTDIKNLGDSIIQKFNGDLKKIEYYIDRLLLKNYNKQNTDIKLVDKKDKFYKDVLHYINNSLANKPEISEDEDGPGSQNDLVYKKDSGGGKPTMILKLGPQSWEKVKDLFDGQGRPGKDVSKLPFERYLWSLHAQKYPSEGKTMYKIYGTSGDSTFGNAPTFYQQKYRGNIKAAKYIFDWFIKKYLSDSINEDEDGPGSSKLSHMSLGMKTTRVVISGDDVAANQEKILKLGQEMDLNFDAKFFPATGKIVGSMSQVKVQPLNLKLRDRKWKAAAEAKAQSQSLKK